MIAKLTEELAVFEGLELIAEDFEKDDDSNFHIDYIHAGSNLRARNYKIGESERTKTK